MRAHLGGLPWKLKKRSLGQACSPAGCMACVCDMLGGTAPHPGDLPGKRIVQIALGGSASPGGPSFGFIRAAGVEWPQQMQEYLKNHHIVVEVSDIWRSEVAWSSGRWDGTFCVMATPEQREAIDALKGVAALLSNGGWMVCRLGVVATGGGCPQVGVVCLADVSLSPGWTECFASEVGPVWCRKYLPMEDPSGMLLMRHVLWERVCLSGIFFVIFRNFRNVAADLGRAGQGQSGYCFELSWNGVDGSSNACICTNLRRNGQLWTMSEGLVVTLGPVKGSTVKPGLLTPAAVSRVLERRGRCATSAGCPRDRYLGWLERVEDNLAKMWQANLTEWYEENPEGDNLKKEETPPSGTTSRRKPRRRGQPQERGNPAVGDNLKGSAGRHRLGGVWT
ncbi:hypothetical protein PAPYR_13293 [Paratrimastix pyriformis]|uniref:Uncharacterized protein n=1 Tax=Paratrimastix pyriformis TaxID=342808 RepID=A0ABQ8U0G8_9EUKA|nr:hypothetical protein PAPYR_13293 [Paratrimastix pyriformis]